jgi:hypothetical protein
MNNDYFTRFWKKSPTPSSSVSHDRHETYSSKDSSGENKMSDSDNNNYIQSLKETIITKEDIYAHPNIHPTNSDAGLPLVHEQHHIYSMNQTYNHSNAQNASHMNNNNTFNPHVKPNTIQTEIQSHSIYNQKPLQANSAMHDILFQKNSELKHHEKDSQQEQKGSIFEHEMYGLIGQYKLFEEQQKSISADTVRYGRLSTAVSSAALFLYYSLHSPVPDGLLAFFAWFYIGLPASIVSSALWKKVAKWFPRSRIIEERREQIMHHFAYKLRQEDYQHELINYLEGILHFVDEHLGTSQSFTHHDLSMQILLLKEAFVLKNHAKAWQHLQIIHQKINFIAQKYDVIMKISQFNDKHMQMNAWRHPEDMEFRPASTETPDKQESGFSSWFKKRSDKNNDKDDFSNLL